MIRYTLVCAAGHGFESWFPSSDSFDVQAARGLVSCPVCGSVRVGKGMMAPSVARTDRGAAASAPAGVPAAPQPAAPPSARGGSAEPSAPVTGESAMGESEQRLRALMRAVREQVTRNADDVGARFPEEARRQHYGETETRAIYGQASSDEARALIEEGIDVAPLPSAPDDRH